MANGTFGLVSMAELQAAKAAGGGVGSVRGYTETPMGAMETPVAEALGYGAGVGLGAGAGLGALAGITGGPEMATTSITPETDLFPSGSPLGSGIIPAIGAAIPALSGIGGAIGTVAGVLGAGYGILQALGLGEGEGLFGLDILGGDTQYVDGVPIGGPGLAEPSSSILLKEWHVQYDWGRLQYYLVQVPGTTRRKILLYNTRTKRWKAWNWRVPHLAVIGKNMPSHKQLTRLKRNLARHTADAKTILKIASPATYAKMTGYRKYSKRRR